MLDGFCQLNPRLFNVIMLSLSCHLKRESHHVAASLIDSFQNSNSHQTRIQNQNQRFDPERVMDTTDGARMIIKQVNGILNNMEPKYGYKHKSVLNVHKIMIVKYIFGHSDTRNHLQRLINDNIRGTGLV